MATSTPTTLPPASRPLDGHRTHAAKVVFLGLSSPGCADNRGVTAVEDTWTNRDLPVLRAVVKIFSQTGRTRIGIEDIQEATGFDKPTTQLALQMLYQEPFFDEGDFRGYSGNYVAVGPPTSAALRLAGAWPTPENMVERLITALEA